MKISIKSALLGLVALVLLVGLIPAGVLLDRRLVGALEQRVRDELSAAPLVVQDRFAANSGAWMMHARDVAVDPELSAAFRRGAFPEAVNRATEVAESFQGENPVVVLADGSSIVGPSLPAEMVERTRNGEMPVLVVRSGEGLGAVSVSAVTVDGEWSGAAGVWIPMDEREAGALSALTRSDVLLSAPEANLAGYTGRAEPAMGLFGLLNELPPTDEVRELVLENERYLVVSTTLPGDGKATFVRTMSEELAVVPALRAVGASVFGLALVVALLVGVGVAGRLARPVRALGDAAGRISDGDFETPVERSAVAEVDQVAGAFEVMRDALAARISELAHANEELEERQERLSVLQAELVQRDRLSATSRLLAQLAHEVRNPVASVRNCLEILRRRVDGDDEASELADLAIDELLRMHELAEQMLDLHRPRATEGDCDASTVAQEVAAVVRVGLGDRELDVEVVSPDREVRVDIPADALKQVLLNLMQNAQDAIEGTGAIEVRIDEVGANARIDVVDNGPGISSDALPQVFDPFFTTKADVRGVGLGLFTAAGVVRSHGGRIAAANRADAAGARLTVELPLSNEAMAEATA